MPIYFYFTLLSCLLFSTYADASHANDYVVKDGGSRKVFETGAVREERDHKGRYDLISPIALKRLAEICEKGALKYEERNWEKGMPISRILDSAMRHINQYREGLKDEDHLAHAFWNLHAALHFDELRKDLNDLPVYSTENTREK